MSWDWPARTNSLQLEAIGYEQLQRTVRFVSVIPPTEPATRHRLLRECHRRGRKAWRYAVRPGQVVYVDHWPPR